MGRTVLAVLAGLVAAFLIISGIQLLGMMIYPPPPGLDPRDAEAFMAAMTKLPIGSLVFVVLSWALGAFGGGWVAARISRNHKRMAALIIGGCIVAAVVSMLLSFPHPNWMSVLGLVLPLPLAWWASTLARGRATISRH